MKTKPGSLTGFRNRMLVVVICMLAIPLAAAGQDTSDRDAVEKSIRGSIGWAKDKDFKLLYSIIANDSGYIEVDPEDRVVKGFNEFRKAEKFWGSPDFKAIRYELRELDIRLSRSGEVAWFFCRLDDINEWKGQEANWLNVRWTGVLEKRDGHWVLVQSHFSYPEREGRR
ncbi:MAG: nuclear transport factor 2 family protein [Bacteroidales bacterium]